jgi:hypothetical protein
LQRALLVVDAAQDLRVDLLHCHLRREGKLGIEILVLDDTCWKKGNLFSAGLQPILCCSGFVESCKNGPL